MKKIAAKNIDTTSKDIELRKIDLWDKLVDRGLPLLERWFDNQHELEKPKIRWSIIGFILMLFLVVICTAVLVFFGKVDGSNFTFLMGTLVGAIITLFGDIVLPKD